MPAIDSISSTSLNLTEVTTIKAMLMTETTTSNIFVQLIKKLAVPCMITLASTSATTHIEMKISTDMSQIELIDLARSISP
jgi:hypothetical protein